MSGRHTDPKEMNVSDAVRRLNPSVFSSGQGSEASPKLFPSAAMVRAAFHPTPAMVSPPNPLANMCPTEPPDSLPEKPRYRSKWEREFHEILKARFKTVEHEPLRLKIGRKAYYKPDFLVVGGFDAAEEAPRRPVNIIFYEVKGHWREAARVRIKVAASKYPWARFIAVVKQKKKDGGGWKEEAFSP